MGKWSVGNANALYRGERPRLHYKTKSNVQLVRRMRSWRGRGGRPLDGSRARRRRRDGVGWGRRSMHSFGCWCWPRKTRVRRNSRGWRGSRTSTQGSQKGHRHPPRGRQSRGHQKGPNIDKHTNNPDASSVCQFAEEGHPPRQKSREITGGSGKPLTSPK